MHLRRNETSLRSVQLAAVLLIVWSQWRLQSVPMLARVMKLKTELHVDVQSQIGVKTHIVHHEPEIGREGVGSGQNTDEQRTSKENSGQRVIVLLQRRSENREDKIERRQTKRHWAREREKHSGQMHHTKDSRQRTAEKKTAILSSLSASNVWNNWKEWRNCLQNWIDSWVTLWDRLSVAPLGEASSVFLVLMVLLSNSFQSFAVEWRKKKNRSRRCWQNAFNPARRRWSCLYVSACFCNRKRTCSSSLWGDRGSFQPQPLCTSIVLSIACFFPISSLFLDYFSGPKWLPFS